MEASYMSEKDVSRYFCPVSGEPMTRPTLIPGCGHIFDYFTLVNLSQCPLCFKEFEISALQDQDELGKEINDWVLSQSGLFRMEDVEMQRREALLLSACNSGQYIPGTEGPEHESTQMGEILCELMRTFGASDEDIRFEMMQRLEIAIKNIPFSQLMNFFEVGLPNSKLSTKAITEFWDYTLLYLNDEDTSKIKQALLMILESEDNQESVLHLIQKVICEKKILDITGFLAV